MYTHQVNFEKQVINGLLKGHRYTGEYIRFTSLDDAVKFAAKEGRVFKSCTGTGDYRMEFPIIVDLANFS